MAPRDRDRSARLMHDALAWSDALYNFARHLTHDAVAAEDLVQETFARALGATAQFVDGGNLKAWLFRIMRNTFIDLYRRDQRARDAPPPATDETVTPPQERQLMGRELEQALLALGDEARLVVLLDLEGFSEAEMADCLGCAPGTVKSRLFRARAALRQKLGQDGE